MTALELDVILEALWEYKRDLDHLRPAAAPAVDKLRRRLLRDSIAQDAGDDWAVAYPALPPEST